MQDVCADLVSQEDNEQIVFSLLSEQPKGQWTAVQELSRKCGVAVDGVTEDQFVAWLDDPRGEPSYVLIVFFDDATKLSAAAHYNRDRLRIGAD